MPTWGGNLVSQWDKEGRRSGAHHPLSHLNLSGEREKKMSPIRMDPLVKEVHQDIQEEGEDTNPTLMTLELKFRSLKAG